MFSIVAQVRDKRDCPDLETQLEAATLRLRLYGHSWKNEPREKLCWPAAALVQLPVTTNTKSNQILQNITAKLTPRFRMMDLQIL
jgi:hypothetical protein